MVTHIIRGDVRYLIRLPDYPTEKPSYGEIYGCVRNLNTPSTHLPNKTIGELFEAMDKIDEYLDKLLKKGVLNENI